MTRSPCIGENVIWEFVDPSGSGEYHLTMDPGEKDALLNLLRTTMDESAEKLRGAADELKNTMKRFDGKEMNKLAFMSFAIAHEMYHRGQLTVYERLLNIQPALTTRFRKAFGESPP